MREPDLHIDAARERIRRAILPVIDREKVDLAAAHGRVLASDLVSPIDVPAHDNSAMDGYAIRVADLDRSSPTSLPLLGSALAGAPWSGELRTPGAVRLMTGAMIPAGADCVVAQELVEASEATASIPPGQRAGQHIRRAGEDLARGQAALRAGRLLGPAELGLAAAIGVDTLTVQRRLRVAVLSTGSELVRPGNPLGRGQVFDANRYSIGASLERPWIERLDLGAIDDDPARIEEALTQAASRADFLVTTGGVSVGEADHLRRIVSRIGSVEFWSLAIRPGRPMAFGSIGRSRYFGLPGNPVATLVAFTCFVEEALRHAAGIIASHTPLILSAVSEEPIAKRTGRSEFPRGVFRRAGDGSIRVRPYGEQGSGILRSMVESNCLIVLEHERGPVEVGEAVWIRPF